jgi:hypothetical protein
MQPILDIRMVQPDLFTYSLGAAVQPDLPCGDFFETAEGCLRDAGEGLSRYFDTVQIRFAGFALGSYPVARMVADPPGLLDELKARVMAICRLWAAPPRRTQGSRERLSSA